MRLVSMVILLLGLSLPTEAGARGTGTTEDPHIVPAFPFAHRATTMGASSIIDRYSCSATTNESGPEVVYRLQLPSRGRVVAWLEGDVAGMVDVDVHLTRDLTIRNREAPCSERGNTQAEAEFDAGTAWVVVDTFTTSAGRMLAGNYTLRIDYSPYEQMRTRTVARGVTWRTTRYMNMFGGEQVVNVMDIDLRARGLSLRPAVSMGCERTSSIGRRVRAVAGVNGGYFRPDCSAETLVRIDHMLLSSNRTDRPPRAALGLSDMGPRIERIAGTDPWPAVRHALGGAPQLMRDGSVGVTWSEEQTGMSFALGTAPRTGACITREGHVVFVTFDGRSEVGSGLSLPNLAQYLSTIGCVDAMNFDGGGSTTMWISTQPFSGVVNYPSDGGMANHLGERPVGNGWFVWAEPFNHPPRFDSTPPTTAREGVAYTYVPEVMDWEFDRLTFEMADLPRTASVDSTTGTVRWTPTWEDEGMHDFAIRVRDGENTSSQQWQVRVSIVDEDGDGLPDSWESQFGTDPRRNDADEDPDGDGVNNGLEFARRTDPRRADLPTSFDGGSELVDVSYDSVQNSSDSFSRDASNQVEPSTGTPPGCSCDAKVGTKQASLRWAAVAVFLLLSVRRRPGRSKISTDSLQ